MLHHSDDTKTTMLKRRAEGHDHSRNRGKLRIAEPVLHFDWERARLMEEEQESIAR